MTHDPISDVLDFLQQPAFVSGRTWPTAVFWVLVLASLAIAVYAFAAIPGQRRATHLWNWVFRFLIGCMWWQQTLWKLPPYYTDHPDQPFGATGLAYWMGLMGKSAAIPPQAEFVNNVVLPHFYVFAPVVYSLEVLTAVSLMLGIFVRFWGVIGAVSDPQPLARPLQCRGGMAVDIFFPARAATDLCGPPLWAQPRP